MFSMMDLFLRNLRLHAIKSPCLSPSFSTMGLVPGSPETWGTELGRVWWGQPWPSSLSFSLALKGHSKRPARGRQPGFRAPGPSEVTGSQLPPT